MATRLKFKDYLKTQDSGIYLDLLFFNLKVARKLRFSFHWCYYGCVRTISSKI